MTERSDHKIVKHVWKTLDKVGTGMLGVPNHPAGGFQPMTAQTDDDKSAIWFFTSRSTDLAGCAPSAEAQFIVISKNHDEHIVLRGDLVAVHDPAEVDRLWNSVVAAWFPGGKTDPNLVLLKFSPLSGEIWESTRNPLKFGFEILKANLTGDQPDVGGKTTVAMS